MVDGVSPTSSPQTAPQNSAGNGSAMKPMDVDRPPSSPGQIPDRPANSDIFAAASLDDPFTTGRARSDEGHTGHSANEAMHQLSSMRNQHLVQTMEFEAQQMQKDHELKMTEASLQAMRSQTNIVEKFANDIGADEMTKAKQAHDARS